MDQKSAQIAELEKAMKSSDTTKAETFRIQGVLLRKRGYKRPEIAQILDKSISVIEDWITAYNKYGIQGLRNHSLSKPRRGFLTNRQKETLRQTITTQTPRDVGIYERDFWNVHTLATLIKRKYGIIYKCPHSYRKLLTQFGLSYQRVEFVDKRRSSKEADHFRERFRAKLKKGGTFVMSW
jgi:transposase